MSPPTTESHKNFSPEQTLPLLAEVHVSEYVPSSPMCRNISKQIAGDADVLTLKKRYDSFSCEGYAIEDLRKTHVVTEVLGLIDSYWNHTGYIYKNVLINSAYRVEWKQASMADVCEVSRRINSLLINTVTHSPICSDVILATGDFRITLEYAASLWTTGKLIVEFISKCPLFNTVCNGIHGNPNVNRVVTATMQSLIRIGPYMGYGDYSRMKDETPQSTK